MKLRLFIQRNRAGLTGRLYTDLAAKVDREAQRFGHHIQRKYKHCDSVDLQLIVTDAVRLGMVWERILPERNRKRAKR